MKRNFMHKLEIYTLVKLIEIIADTKRFNSRRSKDCVNWNGK